MVRDVKSTVTDGLLGMATAKGDGLHVKIGVSPIVSEQPIIITGDMDAAKIKTRLGLSPLADAAMTSVQFGANRIYCIPVSATTAGTITEIVKSGDGSGSVTVDGSPTNEFGVEVKITAQGTLNTAAFTYSIDGGVKFSDELTVPVTGTFNIPGTGLTLTFAPAAQNDQIPSSFIVNDKYTFSTTAPAMTNGDVIAAIDKLKTLTTEYEFVHIVGESSLALWQAVSAARDELATTYKKPVFFVMEAAYPADADLNDYSLELEDDRKKIRNTDIQVCAAWGRLVMLDGTTQRHNLAAIACGLYAKAAVQVSIGKTAPEAGFAIPKTKLLELVPAALNLDIIDLLDVAGFMTFREYDGLDDFYVYHTKMMSPDGSDYRYAEDVRVKNKIIRETRKKGLLVLNDDIDLEDVQGELETRAKFMFEPLQRMIDAREISSAKIIVPEGQTEDIIHNETMRVNVRYVSRGYIREVEIDIGRTQPTD